MKKPEKAYNPQHLDRSICTFVRVYAKAKTLKGPNFKDNEFSFERSLALGMDQAVSRGSLEEGGIIPFPLGNVSPNQKFITSGYIKG